MIPEYLIELRPSAFSDPIYAKFIAELFPNGMVSRMQTMALVPRQGDQLRFGNIDFEVTQAIYPLTVSHWEPCAIVYVKVRP